MGAAHASCSSVHRRESGWEDRRHRRRQALDASNSGGLGVIRFISVLASDPPAARRKEPHYRRPKIRLEACCQADFVGPLLKRWSGRWLLRPFQDQLR